MTTESTLLSFITRRYISAREDAATDALGFILNRSEAARKGLSDVLQATVSGIAPIASVQNQFADADGGIPDLACFDAGNKVQALIEAKFWAALTYHQPNTYWSRLPSDRPAALVFLAPTVRLPGLLKELFNRLQQQGFQLGQENCTPGLISAQDKASQRHLILISWDELLRRLAESARSHADKRAEFEIAQLQGVAAREFEDENLERDAVLRNLIRDAINQARQEGWVNTDGLSSGGHAQFSGWYLRLSGAYAFLGLNYAGWQETGQPFWLVFYRRDAGCVTGDQVRFKLEDRGNTGRVLWRDTEYSVPLQTPPPGADHQARIHFIVDQLAEIARLLDPNSPIYKEDSSNA